MKKIINILPNENRQSMLFSATQTTKVTDLARISLRPGPLYIDVDKTENTSTVATLSQGYVVCPSDRRFLLLFTFLKKHLKKKIVVFFSSCNSVKYHAELLNYIDVPVLDLHVRVLLLHCAAIHIHDSNRANKNSRSGRTRSSNSATPSQVFCSVQMLLPVVSTFRALIGLSSTTPQMIPAITFTV